MISKTNKFLISGFIIILAILAFFHFNSEPISAAPCYGPEESFSCFTDSTLCGEAAAVCDCVDLWWDEFIQDDLDLIQAPAGVAASLVTVNEYTVYLSTDSSFPVGPPGTEVRTAGTNNTFLWEGLDEDTTYYWKVEVDYTTNLGPASPAELVTCSFNTCSPNDPPFVVPDSMKYSDKYCEIAKATGQISFEWEYDDPEGESQSQYNLQIATDSGFSNLVVDYTAPQSIPAGSTGSSMVIVVPSPTPAIDDLDIGYRGETHPYYWRIKVQDESGTWSANWFYPPGTTTPPGEDLLTPKHAWPWPEFSWLPSLPSAQEEIQFDGRGKWCYNSAMDAIHCPPAGYVWDFGDGDTLSGDKTPTHSYLDEGEYIVRLEVTDAHGYTCPISHILTVGLPLPEWREVPPIIWYQNLLAKISETFRSLVYF